MVVSEERVQDRGGANDALAVAAGRASRLAVFGASFTRSSSPHTTATGTGRNWRETVFAVTYRTHVSAAHARQKTPGRDVRPGA
jgi:hypothetical protein